MQIRRVSATGWAWQTGDLLVKSRARGGSGVVLPRPEGGAAEAPSATAHELHLPGRQRLVSVSNEVVIHSVTRLLVRSLFVKSMKYV